MKTAKILHPVKWQIESLAGGGYYAYAWGGGLPEAVSTGGFDTKAAALAELRVELRKVGRCPDPALCNERTPEGLALLTVLE